MKKALCEMKAPLSLCLRAFISALLFSAVCFSAAAANKEEFDPFTASIEENISTPAVPVKHRAAVVSGMNLLANTLKNARYTVERVRSSEVVVVTIPCSELFAPNSSELKISAEKRLLPLVPYIKRSDNYKVVIAVHADNTGDSSYADALTADRATAVDNFFYNSMGKVDTQAIPYGIGSDEPVESNATVAGRAANRRVEIYFIPTQEFIDKAKKKNAVQQR